TRQKRQGHGHDGADEPITQFQQMRDQRPFGEFFRFLAAHGAEHTPHSRWAERMRLRSRGGSLHLPQGCRHVEVLYKRHRPSPAGRIRPRWARDWTGVPADPGGLSGGRANKYPDRWAAGPQAERAVALLQRQPSEKPLPERAAEAQMQVAP